MEVPQNIFVKFKVFKATRDRIASIYVRTLGIFAFYLVAI